MFGRFGSLSAKSHFACSDRKGISHQASILPFDSTVLVTMSAFSLILFASTGEFDRHFPVGDDGFRRPSRDVDSAPAFTISFRRLAIKVSARAGPGRRGSTGAAYTS